MDDDTNSTASFEDVVERFRDMSRIGAFAETNADAPPQVDTLDEDVPDICYVLQRDTYRDGLVEVHRGPKPIDSATRDALGDGNSPKRKMPVLEIVTVLHNPSDYDDGRRQRDTRRHRSDWTYSPRHLDSGDDIQRSSHVETTMVIWSRHLINALAAVVEYWPDVSFTGKNVRIDAPYHMLVHHSKALEQYKTSQPESHDEEYAATTTKHIDLLLGYLEETYGQRTLEERERHNRETPTATYDWLWLLFRPGEVVYTRHHDTWTPFVISNFFASSDNDRAYYALDCWHYAYMDGQLRRKIQSFNVYPFSGEQAIHNLTVIPARFFKGPDGDMSPSDLTADHVRLGKLVWDLHKEPSYRAYDGDLAKDATQPDWDPTSYPAGYMNGRVIVDGEGYELHCDAGPRRRRRRCSYDDSPRPRIPVLDRLPYFAPHCGCETCKKRDRTDNLSSFAVFRDLDPKRDRAPESDLYYHVVSKVVAGFLLGERRWGHFHAGKLREIEFDQEAFKYLVLDYEIKMTVKALMGKFASTGGNVSSWSSDFVKDKGQGRIFLLHGPPGVGKTCTAECVAELTRRPLLSLTSGDLSTYSHVERQLEYFLTLGERFGAIVLLDEADVYLESRRDKDIDRNGLVSVFLRALEYYRGVLFLTTNRVRTFDSAFTSRIHVALHYEPLTNGDRERIWMNGFDRLEREAAGRILVAGSAREYACANRDVRALRWNGREIRNALQTAVALAESEAVEDERADSVVVVDKHIRSVVRMSRGFKNFMREGAMRRGYDDGAEDGDDDEDEDEDDDEDGDNDVPFVSGGSPFEEYEKDDDDDDEDVKLIKRLERQKASFRHRYGTGDL